MRRLEGKTALVTGAARGIGEAIAKAFVREGAFVYVTDIDLDRGPRVAMELAGGAAWQALDVREESHWQQALERVAADSRSLDIVVNNAGITGFEGGPLAHDPENASLEDRRAVHRTNLDGVFLGCKYAIRAMKEKGAGSIVNVSSRSGLVGIPAAAAYASSKAAGVFQSHQERGALLRGQGLAHPLQFAAPGRDSNPHVGTGAWPPRTRARSSHAGLHRRLPAAAVRRGSKRWRP